MNEPQGPADVFLGGFTPSVGGNPPFLGAVRPITKPTDPPEAMPQEMPFFRSRQFRLWNSDELDEFNKLNDVLVKWQNKGWCQFSEESEFVPTKENWISWIKYYVLLTIPAEEMHLYLYDLDTMNIPRVAKES
jgi:hypothetical protein